MPIYEYLCEHCGKASTFFVRNIRTHSTPACPHCGRSTLRRLVSRFAAVAPRKSGSSGGSGEPDSGEDLTGEANEFAERPEPDRPEPDLSEMEAMLENLDENDPRAMGRVMRKLAEQTGEPLDEEMEEVVRRLEAGEDPEKIEEKMGGSGDTDAGDEWYDG